MNHKGCTFQLGIIPEYALQEILNNYLISNVENFQENIEDFIQKRNDLINKNIIKTQIERYMEYPIKKQK